MGGAGQRPSAIQQLSPGSSWVGLYWIMGWRGAVCMEECEFGCDGKMSGEEEGVGEEKGGVGLLAAALQAPAGGAAGSV